MAVLELSAESSTKCMCGYSIVAHVHTLYLDHTWTSIDRVGPTLSSDHR